MTLVISRARRNVTAALLLSMWAWIGCRAVKRSDLPPIHSGDFSAVLWPAVQQAYMQVQADPGNAKANGRLAIILHSGGKYELGERFYERAIAKDPSFRWLYYLSQLQTLKGDKQKAALTLERALRLDERYLAARLKYGRLLLDTSRPAEARTFLEETLRLHPSSAIAEFELGRVLKALGQKQESISRLERACARLPEYGAAQYALAVAYRDQGRMDEAKARFLLYERYKDRLPTQDDPLEREFLAVAQGTKRELDLAKEALHRGDLVQVASHYEAALAREPENITVRTSLIAVYYELRKFDKSEAHYREAVRRDPKHAEAHYNYGMALLAQQRGAEAEALFRLAIQANPAHAGALTQFGLLREKAGDDPVAIESYRKALAGEPALRQALFLLGRQLVRQKKYDEGIAYLEKTVSPEDQQTPWFIRALAGAQSEAGRPAMALQLAAEAKVKAQARKDEALVRLLDQDIANYRRLTAAK